MSEDSERGLSRREFAMAALAIGGTQAFAACAEREGVESDPRTPAYPTGTDPETLPDRQHAWNEFLATDRFANTVSPQHQLVLLLEYVGSTPPTDEERATVAEALHGVEAAVQWGTGSVSDTPLTEGVLFTLGYAPTYFETIGAPTPESVDLPRPESVIDRLGEDARPDGADAALVVASGYGSLVLAAEAALFGEVDHLNGSPISATLEGVFERTARRTGVAGRGLPAEHLEQEEIPEQSPLSMGFKSGFHDNIPPEDNVTIETGPFAGGTTQLVSRLALDLERWYDRSHDERVSLMFSPHHDPEDVGETGVDLAQHSGVTPEMTEDLEAEAREHGCLGHTQKAAAARDDDFDPVILRRSESVATDTEGTAFNFTSVQRTIEDFTRTREAMNAPDDDAVPAECDGILSFMEVVSRGTYLVPPRGRRALPVTGRGSGDG